MSLPSHNPSSRLACLAVLAAFAGVLLVGCGAGPGAKAQPDPVKIKDVVFEKVGTEREIPLGDKFSGEGLAYTATSSNKAVATVMVDNEEDILAVTAVGAGEATITVTAADSQDRTASQTFKVTTSEPEPGAPTVKDGAPTSVDFEAGESTTKTVTLSQVFEGDDLTYSAPESDDTDVAIASISNRVLIIRAGDPGEATITVTATNAKGEAEHEIAVTVPDPDDDDDPDDGTGDQLSTTCRVPPFTLTITIPFDDTKKCTIPNKHTLKGPDDDEPRNERRLLVEESDDGEALVVWDITAKRKGIHTVIIFDGGGKQVGSITVDVPNSAPKRTDSSVPEQALPEDSATAAYITTGDLDLETYFRDPDDGDVLRYRVQSNPDWVLVETKNGFVVTDPDNDAPTETKLRIEVLKKVGPKDTFKVTLYASDDSGEESNLPVTITFANNTTADLDPRRITDYNVQQQASNGNLSEGAMKIGPRRGVQHTLEFKEVSIDAGFKFAHIEENKVARNLLPDDHQVNIDSRYYKDASGAYFDSSDNGVTWPIPTTDQNPGYEYLVLESSGVVEEARWATSGADEGPKVTFKLKEKGASGSISIRYYLVPRISAPTEETESPGPASKPRPSVSKSLVVNVKPCTSPPDPIVDCP